MQYPRGLWTVPEIWRNGECFILGGGPSLADQVASGAVNRLQGRHVIAVNNGYELGDWIDVLFYADCRWLNWHWNALVNWPGLKVTTCDGHLSRQGIKVVRRKNSPFGVSIDRGVLFWNLSSGACAIGLAAHFGVKRIVLLGFDMKRRGERNNWHTKHPSSDQARNPYARFLRPFPEIAEGLKRRGIECLNASPDSAIDAFPKVSLETLL
jgi:hypothetical protein